MSRSELKTDWKSMWIAICLQFLIGVQLSVYYMSMWPYLSGIDSTADMDFLGWIVAACSVGQTISTPLYGYWNQKTGSVRWPTITGFILAGMGQVWYGLLHLFPNVKWAMLFARFLTGLGVGNIAAIRVYAATASTAEDRMKAISFGIAGFASGFSFGPIISAVFTPLGEQGVTFLGVRFNMYTSVSFLMLLVSLIACLIVHFCLNESYPGIVSKEEKESENIIIPNFDIPSALICVFLFMITTIIATNVEVMSTPLTTVLYDWKDADSVFYNGIVLFFSCTMSVSFNIIQGATRMGKIDKRHQMLIGTVIFLLYNLFMYPWTFYSGPLNFIPSNETSITTGGCLPEYTWCLHTTRPPIYIYIFCFVVFFGIAFPLIEAPSAALYSEVLGPRKQGNMQGLFSFGGSIAPVIGSLVSTTLFQHTGYRYVIVFQTVILVIGAALILLFYKRLVPLKVIRNNDK